VAWYHDLILSKCAEENKIVLWRIEGFDSSQAPPSPDSAPTTHEFRPTRSAFGGTYQRLLQFECADTSSFYMRFSLFTQPQQRPILAIGNTRSRIFLWDLQSLELWEGRDSDDDFKIPRAPQRGVAPRLGKQREGSVASETTTTTTHTGSSAGWSNTPASNAADDGRVDGRSVRGRDRYQVDDPFRVLGPHKTHVVQKITFASRQVAWSVGGEWMVVVGDQGMIALFGR
jgi:polycomb protein EED